MNTEQRKRARLAVQVPAVYGLVSGLWTLAPGVDYPYGVVLTALTAVLTWLLNVGALLLRCWIMDTEPDNLSLLKPYWQRAKPQDVRTVYLRTPSGLTTYVELRRSGDV